MTDKQRFDLVLNAFACGFLVVGVVVTILACQAVLDWLL